MLNASAQWQASNISNVTYFPIPSSTSHDGELYGTVHNTALGTLYKMDASGTSWTAQTVNGIADKLSFAQSANDRLYLGSIGLGYSLLHYTEDGGATTVVDTVGLPQANGGISQMYGTQYNNGDLVVNLGGAGYWIKTDPNASWYYMGTPTGLNGGVDPMIWLNGTYFAFEGSSNTALYSSSDKGVTWNTVTNNLPADFDAIIGTTDEVTGTLYIAGSWNSDDDFGLYYSTDNGTTWTWVDLTAFMDTNYLTGLQLITAIYADNDVIFIGMQNDAQLSVPDVISSTSGVTGFAVNTNGLPTNAAGAVNPIGFTEHNGQIACRLNVIDVFLQDISTDISEMANQAVEIHVYPNPTTDRIFIDNFSRQGTVEFHLLDNMGRTVRDGTLSGSSIIVSDLVNGFYYIQFKEENGIIGSATFLKN